MKKVYILIFCLLGLFILTCCNKLTECEKKGHSFINATCESPKTCSKCNTTEGDPLGHDFIDATYTAPATCSRCNITKGTPLTDLNATISNDCISISEYAYIRIPNYYDMTSFAIEYDSSLVSIDNNGKVIGLKKGMANIKITKINDESLVSYITIEIIATKPKVYTALNKIGINQKTYINIANFTEIEENSLADFNITFKNNLLKLNSDYSIEGLSIGTETITVSSKTDSRVLGTQAIEVVDNTTNYLLSDVTTTGVVPAGTQIKLNLNLTNTSNIVWSTSNSKLAVVNDKGVINTKAEGIVSISIYDKTDISNKAKKCTYTLIIEGSTEVDYVSRVIRMALGEYGTKETGNNIQKYGEWYGYNGAAWCAMFVSWTWHHAGLTTDLLCKYMGCTAGLTWCAEQDIVHFVRNYTFSEPLSNGKQAFIKENYTPASGDIVFFLNGISHTGIVIYADDTYIYTIEGNTSDMVAVRRWKLDDSRITAYAKPNYPECSNPEDFSWIKNPLSDGTYWWDNAGDNSDVL